MGVRMYTPSMHLTSTLVRPVTDSSRLVIDVRSLQNRLQSGFANEELGALIRLVKNCPDRSAVRVVVGNSIRSPAGRRLQNTLQSLGCTITARVSFG